MRGKYSVCMLTAFSLSSSSFIFSFCSLLRAFLSFFSSSFCSFVGGEGGGGGGWERERLVFKGKERG